MSSFKCIYFVSQAWNRAQLLNEGMLTTSSDFPQDIMFPPTQIRRTVNKITIQLERTLRKKIYTF